MQELIDKIYGVEKRPVSRHMPGPSGTGDPTDNGADSGLEETGGAEAAKQGLIK